MLVAAGLTNPQIARLSGAAINTVINHCVHAMRKLGAETRQDLVFLAIAYGYIDQETVTIAAEMRCEARRLINKLREEYKMAVGIEKMVEMANRALSEFQEAQAIILADQTLSDTGKLQKIESARQTMIYKVEEARKLASGHLATMEERVNGAADRARAKAADHRRRLIGDQVTAMIYREQMMTAGANDMIKMIDQAPSEWDREVMIGFAQAVLAGRRQDDYEVANALYELSQLSAANQPSEVHQALEDERDLRRAYKQLERLSVDEMRDAPRRLGLQSAEYLELPIG